MRCSNANGVLISSKAAVISVCGASMPTTRVRNQKEGPFVIRLRFQCVSAFSFSTRPATLVPVPSSPSDVRPRCGCAGWSGRVWPTVPEPVHRKSGRYRQTRYRGFGDDRRGPREARSKESAPSDATKRVFPSEFRRMPPPHVKLAEDQAGQRAGPRNPPNQGRHDYVGDRTQDSVEKHRGIRGEHRMVPIRAPAIVVSAQMQCVPQCCGT